MRNKEKIVKYVITALLAVWLVISFVFSAQINRYLSTFSPWISEDSAIIDYYSEDYGVNFELMPGEALSLPVMFESRIARIGVYLGEQADSPDEYVFQLEDKYGSILGKVVKCLSEIQADDFVYIASRSIISTDDVYYIKIFSEDGNTDGDSLWLNTSLAESFQTVPFSVGDRESGQTLVLDRRYQAVNNKILVYIDLVLIGLVAVIWIAMSNTIKSFLKKTLNQCVKVIPWRKVNLAAIAVLLVANIALLLLPRTQYMVQAGNARNSKAREQVISLSEGIILEQHIQPEGGAADTLSILFATYTQEIRGGTVHVELWDESSNTLICDGSIATERIYDNEYQYFQLPESIELQDREFCIRLWVDSTAEDQHVAVYLNENHSSSMFATENGEELGYSLVFDLASQVKLYRMDTAIIVNSILLVLVMLYVWNFIRFKKPITRYLLCACLSSILLLAPVLSFVNYDEISMNGMVASLMDRSEWSPNRTYNQEVLAEHLTVEREYNFVGEVHAIYEKTEIPVNGMVSDVSLNFLGDTMKWKDYDIQIYWDTGNGYNEKQSYTHKYIHQGGDKVTFAIPCSEFVRNIMINVGVISDRSYDLPDRILCLTNAVLNVNDSVFHFLASGVVGIFTCIAFTVIFCLWKYFDLDERIGGVFTRKKISISLVFVIIATICGGSIAFLIPTGQVPDEGAHIRMLYTDIREPNVRNMISQALANQGTAEVLSNPGRAVDLQSYIAASQNKLEDYSFHYGMPSLRIIRRPGQVLGVLIGQLLHLPAYWILQLGELGALAVYIILGVLTLKLMPFKKNLMMLIMLLPMVLQEAGSFAYDSFTNAVSFLTISYILHLKVTAPKVTWKEIMILILLAACLLLGKGIYVLLLGLVLIIPLDKLELCVGKVTINKEWLVGHKGATITFLIIGFCIALVGGPVALNVLGYKTALNYLVGYLTSGSQLLRLFVTSIYVHWKSWLQGTTAYFGWFDTPANDLFMWVVVGSAFIFALIHHRDPTATIARKQDSSTAVFSKFNLLVWYGVFSILFVVVLMSMISWGFFIYGIDRTLPYSVSMRLLPRIEGVQGRYFFPILPLLFIPMHTKRDVLIFIPTGLYKICYYLLVTVYPISLLLVRYWGVGSW